MTAHPNTDDDGPDELDPFAERIRLWNRTIAVVPRANKPMAFSRCLGEAVAFVEQGAPRGRIADELIQCAEGHNLIDTLGGLAACEKLVGHALAKAAAPSQGENGPDKGGERTNYDSGVGLEDFVAYMPTHGYIFKPTREFWAGSSVNSRVPPVPLTDSDGRPVLGDDGEQKLQRASGWLDQNRPVEQMTWSPGDPMMIEGKLVNDGGWIERPDCRTFNLYLPPRTEPGNAVEAERWLELAYKVFGDNDKHIIRWLAHRVQRPHEKVNHALVLGGAQGIGKDTMLAPVVYGVGPWNFKEVSPSQVMGRFNGFLKSVVLRISEARDSGDVDRYKFYDHMKAYIAAPPDVLRVDEKNLREHAVFNVTGVIITTNHLNDGIYLPADDRRHFVAWSNLTKDSFVDKYWARLWQWYGDGGIRHVASYLAELDLSGFDPKAPPPKTDAFWSIVNTGRAPESAELADILDALGRPDVTTLVQLKYKADQKFEEWLEDRKNRRAIGHRLEECGYVRVNNDLADDGLWRIKGKRQTVYARKDLTVSEAITAARKLTGAK